MSFFRTVMILVLFTVTLNAIAHMFATTLPSSVAYSGSTDYNMIASSADLNFQQISTTNTNGFALDVGKGMSLLANLPTYVFGGGSIAQRFGMDPNGVVATTINGIEGVVYIIGLMMLFLGRGD